MFAANCKRLGDFLEVAYFSVATASESHLQVREVGSIGAYMHVADEGHTSKISAFALNYVLWADGSWENTTR